MIKLSPYEEEVSTVESGPISIEERTAPRTVEDLIYAIGEQGDQILERFRNTDVDNDFSYIWACRAILCCCPGIDGEILEVIKDFEMLARDLQISRAVSSDTLWGRFVTRDPIYSIRTVRSNSAQGRRASGLDSKIVSYREIPGYRFSASNMNATQDWGLFVQEVTYRGTRIKSQGPLTSVKWLPVDANGIPIEAHSEKFGFRVSTRGLESETHDKPQDGIEYLVDFLEEISRVTQNSSMISHILAELEKNGIQFPGLFQRELIQVPSSQIIQGILLPTKINLTGITSVEQSLVIADFIGMIERYRTPLYRMVDNLKQRIYEIISPKLSINGHTYFLTVCRSNDTQNTELILLP